MTSDYTREELELLESIENGDWKSIDNLEAEKMRFKEYAANTLRKDKRINIRMSERDLLELQKKALEEGIPYQTLINTVLHKYITNQLLDKNEVLKSIQVLRNKEAI